MMPESFFSWVHLEVIGTILIPIGIAWWTSRTESKRMHQENQERLIEIETKMDAVWDWWKKLNGGRS